MRWVYGKKKCAGNYAGKCGEMRVCGNMRRYAGECGLRGFSKLRGKNAVSFRLKWRGEIYGNHGEMCGEKCGLNDSPPPPCPPSRGRADLLELGGDGGDLVHVRPALESRKHGEVDLLREPRGAWHRGGHRTRGRF